MPSARRSARAKPSKKYTIDPFEGIQKLLVVSSDSGSDTSEPESSGGEDEFDLQQAAAVEAAEAIADEDEILSPVRLPLSSVDAATVAGEDSDGDGAEMHSIANLVTPGKQHISKRVATGVDISQIHKVPAFDDRGTKALYKNVARFSRRGIPDVPHVLAKESRVIYSVGPATEDIVAHIRCRDKWINQPTMPTRNPTRDNVGGLRHSFFYSNERHQKEASEGWEWYYNHGCRETFAQEQKTSFISLTEAESLLRQTLKASDPFLFGPSTCPQLIGGLKPLAAFNTAPAWDEGKKASTKSAWILNAGTKVQCLEWVPNQYGLSQYLSVATRNESATLGESDRSNAYTPSSSYQTCLQIWEFTSLASQPTGGREIDYSKAPVLRFVLSFDWGHLKKLKWCPIPDRMREDISEEQTLQLGLLAGVWEDGEVRVLDLKFAYPESKTTRHVYVSKAAFESKSSGTIYTGVAWLSSSSIAASCSNGYVAIWNIGDNLKMLAKSSRKLPSHQEYPARAKPWFYQQIHQGYILGLVSAYPSRPHLLISKGIEGYIRLTDVRAPYQDTALAPRDRVAQPHLLWHDVSQTALSTDENYDLKSYGLRLFYKSQAVGRMDALVTDMAVSPVHPFILLGCASGTVWTTSPLKRLREHKKPTYQQMWFKHEWRRGTSPLPQPPRQSEERDTAMQDVNTECDEVEPRIYSGTAESKEPDLANILSKPLIRFTEGYKLDTPDLSQHQRPNTTKQDSVAFVTVYEEQTAVTKVCWNPNLCCGTWAAASMASGLIRVEDLGVD
jgi:transcription factor C subunit 6